MALTLAEAWGDLITPPRTEATRPTETVETEKEIAEESVEHRLQEEVIDKVIYQFELLRTEQSKRSTTYVIITCILFAILFWYIDKLNNRIGYLMMMQWKQGREV